MTRSWMKVIFACIMTGVAGLGLGHFLTASAVLAQTQQVPKRASPPVPLVVLAAQKIGIRRCLPAIKAIAERGVTGVTMQDIVLNWDHATPDDAPFFSLTGMGKDTQRAALSITAVPTTSSCAVMVERVSSGGESCATVAARELSGMVGGQLINGIIVYQNPRAPEETYTLIQSQGSCTVIRRQAIFQWPPKS